MKGRVKVKRRLNVVGEKTWGERADLYSGEYIVVHLLLRIYYSKRVKGTRLTIENSKRKSVIVDMWICPSAHATLIDEALKSTLLIPMQQRQGRMGSRKLEPWPKSNAPRLRRDTVCPHSPSSAQVQTVLLYTIMGIRHLLFPLRQ
jgi:hypothetical protein